MTTVTMKNNVLTLTRPTSFEVDIENFAVCVEERGLLNALAEYTEDEDIADDFYEDHRNELLVMVAKYWIEEYVNKCGD